MAVMLLLFFFTGATAYELQNVFIFSRHNIRTPLAEQLQQYTPKPVPKWNENPSYLTAKGALMEEYMGRYFNEWLTDQNFITAACPDEKTVRFHANNRQRTIETAKSFAKTLFEDCDIPILHKDGDGVEDPLFSLLFTNRSYEYKDKYLNETNEKLRTVDLKEAFSLITRILKLNESGVCLHKTLCDLTEMTNVPLYELGMEPDTEGPLKIGNSIVDMFLMQYYDGALLNDIGWGEINKETFENLMKVSRKNLDVRFNTTIASKYLLRRFLDYASDSFINGGPKLIIFFGHDSNMVALLKAFKFKPFALPDHLEAIPLGGKIVFQTWYDKASSSKFMKVNFVYPSMEQLRAGDTISSDNPPVWVNLQFKNCENDKDGFCPYDDFIKNVIGKL